MIVASARLQSTGRGSALGGLWFPERSLHVEVPLPGDRSNLDNPTGLAVVPYVDVPSLELAARFFPDVPIRGDLSGHRSFFSSAKAEKLLGWKHNESVAEA